MRYPSRTRIAVLLGIGAALCIPAWFAPRIVEAVSERQERRRLAAQLLSESDPVLRRETARKLAHSESPVGRDLEILVDGAYLTTRVSHNLLVTNDTKVVRALLKALREDSDGEVRMRAAQGLTFCQAGRSQVTDALIDVMKNTDLRPELRSAAAMALARGNGGLRAVEEAERALRKESDPDVLHGLIDGLWFGGWLLGPPKGHEDKRDLSGRMFQRTLDLAKGSSDQEVREGAFFVLTSRGVPSKRRKSVFELACLVLRERERCPRMLRAAVFVVGDHADQPGALELLRGMAESDPDKQVQQAAAKVLAGIEKPDGSG